MQVALRRAFGTRLEYCELLLSQGDVMIGALDVLKALYTAVNAANAADAPGSQVLFYFDGHAERRKGAGYLVMADGHDDLPMAQVFLVFEMAGVPMVALLDACHSGTVLRSGLLRQHENSMALVPRLTVLCASYDDSEAAEVGREGLFTSSLVEVVQQCGTAPMHAEDVGRAVEKAMAMRQGGGDEHGWQVPCQRSFPEASNEELCRRFCFTFGPCQP